MNPLNIDQLMAYGEVPSHVLNVSEWEHAYKISPKGTLTYYGVVEKNVDYFRLTGRALQPKHRAVVDDLLAAIYDGYATELTFQIVVEPIQNPDGYDYACQHLALTELLAAELTEYCGEAQRLGKSLGVIVRFGSEMNDIDGTAGTRNPDEFIRAFRAVRGVFSETLPEALFRSRRRCARISRLHRLPPTGRAKNTSISPVQRGTFTARPKGSPLRPHAQIF